jgi:hypothetical protein
MRKVLLFTVFFLSLAVSVHPAQAATTLAQRLSGRILLQVEDKGQAWYVNPLDLKRYYLGRPEDALSLMRTLGLGISNADFDTFYFSAPRRLYGRILLKVQDSGKAYYIDPINGHLYYLGRPADALIVIRNRGLGIKNSDLALIPVATNSPAVSASVPVATPATPGPTSEVSAGQRLNKFVWKYNNRNYYLYQVFSDEVYAAYSRLPRTLTYNPSNPPANLRESFYNMFLQVTSGDASLDDLVRNLKALAAREGYNEDQSLEFIMAFIQFIPYDFSKLDNNQANYIYETLYRMKGVCSDKSFLALEILKRLGYGGAIFDYPSIKHSAVGVSCPVEYSTYGSGYCFIETTNYFPVGVLPQALSANGQASSTTYDNLNDIFKSNELSSYDILNRQPGKEYRGIITTMQTAGDLQRLHDAINLSKKEIAATNAALVSEQKALTVLADQLNAYRQKGDNASYNNLVPQYNQAVSDYNSHVAIFRAKVQSNNDSIADYNQRVNTFFQN